MLDNFNAGNTTDSDFEMIASAVIDKTDSDWQDNWSFIGKANNITSLSDLNNNSSVFNAKNSLVLAKQQPLTILVEAQNKKFEDTI